MEAHQNSERRTVTGLDATSERLSNGTRVLSVAGEIDMQTAPRFENELLAAIADGFSGVIIDLTKCDFLDSSALNALVRANKRLNGAGPIALVIPNPHLVNVFEITRLDGVFTIRPTRAAAMDGKPLESLPAHADAVRPSPANTSRTSD